jgi:hypothetical protein
MAWGSSPVTLTFTTGNIRLKAQSYNWYVLNIILFTCLVSTTEELLDRKVAAPV